MTTEQHLEHLKAMIAPPYTNGWWAYAKARAEELAMQESEYASLPVLLHAEHQRIAEEVRACQPQRSAGSNSRRTAPREIVSRETTPAPTLTHRPKDSTGLPASS